MLIMNNLAEHGLPLEAVDAATLSESASLEVQRFLAQRPNHVPTLLRSLPALAGQAGVVSIEIKDESSRLGMGSFKALGGSYAVIRIALEKASDALGRQIDVADLDAPKVRAVTAGLTVGCATDGNHGKSVAAGAGLVGAKAAIFVHAGVSDERVAAIAGFGAEIIRVEGTYDDSVELAARHCAEKGWIVVSDTSWPGYERVPALVMQGYTAMLREAVDAFKAPPTHVFIQAGVGGLAAAVAGYFEVIFGRDRPKFIVVEPERAACVLESVRLGRPVKIEHGEPTIMAMLECYEPSLVAWRILKRTADAFMTVGEEDAAAAMRRLAAPGPGDPAIVAGESGGAGLAGLFEALKDPRARAALDLGPRSRIFLINTEGATDKARYRSIVGESADAVQARADDVRAAVS